MSVCVDCTHPSILPCQKLVLCPTPLPAGGFDGLITPCCSPEVLLSLRRAAFGREGEMGCGALMDPMDTGESRIPCTPRRGRKLRGGKESREAQEEAEIKSGYHHAPLPAPRTGRCTASSPGMCGKWIQASLFWVEVVMFAALVSDWI